MGKLDLDAQRAARQEQTGEPHTITFGGVDFFIAPKCSYDLLEQLSEFAALSKSGIEAEQARSVAALSRSMQIVFGDEQWQMFRDLGPEPEDVFELCNGITKLYGLGDLGEAPGSGKSSETIGELPKPTSNGSTASTSPEPASVPTS